MSDLATSQVEKHFITNKVYKRSRRYFDIAKLNQIEHELQICRRKPYPCKDTIDTRLSSSFICSEQLLHDKVNNDLDYFHSRKDWHEDNDQTDTNYTIKTARANTVDMKKMLPRDVYDRTKPVTNNEQQFNNFSVSLCKPRASLDFDNFIGRNEDKSSRNSPKADREQRYDAQSLGKSHQKLIFDQSHNSCFVDYNKSVLTKEKKNQSSQSPTYQLSKIQRGETLTKKRAAHLLQFYNGNAKNEPSQLDNRILKQNEYFWRHLRAERQRLKDFTVNKSKQDLQIRKIQAIKIRKNLPDDRHEMCDEKYFRRAH